MHITLIRFFMMRMLRSWLVQILLILVPIAVISIVGLVENYVAHADSGMPPMDWIAISLMLGFQLFGGSLAMSYLHEDLLKSRKWRLRSLPISAGKYSNAMIAASTAFSVAQGLAIVLFTAVVYGVNWGNPLFLLLALVSISFFSQLVCVIFTFAIRSIKLAERMTEVFGIGCMFFAGLFFRLPDNAFFQFMSTYGNPISLGQNFLFGMIYDGSAVRSWSSLGLLLAAIAVLLPIAAVFGARRLNQ